MKKHIISSISALTFSIITSNAFAAHDAGAYAEVNLGWADASQMPDSLFEPSVTVHASGPGANANLGYQFNRFFAAEAGYTYYAKDINLSLGDAAVKGILPVGDNFSLFAKLGGSYVGGSLALYAKGKAPGASVFYGAGAAYAITPALDINLQYQGASNDFLPGGVVTVGLVSAGLTYHF